MANKIFEIVKEHKAGNPVGVCSVCSANNFVIEAAIKQAKENHSFVLIESTSNQVDQFGGYTGMRPKDFADYVYSIAAKMSFPFDKIVLGGDHLGPNVWQKEEAASAMEKAKEQIAAYVNAGYNKIHLDASMRLGGDGPSAPLQAEVIAKRTVELCKAAESSAKGKDEKPVYIIGSDVPIPGGAQDFMESIHITAINEIDETIEISKKFFAQAGLQEAWERVIGIVVQPGVEFSDDDVFYYKSEKAQSLARFIEKNDQIVYEAHSTDYQTQKTLSQLVEDHFAILKVGPWLTYTFREALFALDTIEREYLASKNSIELSGLKSGVLNIMKNDPQYWKNHYQGTEEEIEFACKYSLSDRIRYYWPNRGVGKSIQRLIKNLSEQPVPLSLISQYLPAQYTAVVEGKINLDPIEIIHDKIGQVLNIYNKATRTVEPGPLPAF